MSEKKIQMQVKSSSGYDILYPQTVSDNVTIPASIANQYGIPTNGQGVSTMNEALGKLSSGKMDAKIGDLMMTTRSDVGNEWLYCNGDEVLNSEYPQLSQKMLNLGNINPIIFNYMEYNLIFDGLRWITMTSTTMNSTMQFAYCNNSDFETAFNLTSYGTSPWKQFNCTFSLTSNSNYIMKFTYLNNKYILFFNGYENGYQCIYVAYYNSFNNLMSNNGTLKKICQLPSNYTLQNYDYTYLRSGFNFIYQNGYYSFVSSIRTSNNTPYTYEYDMFSSSSLDSTFQRTKIFNGSSNELNYDGPYEFGGYKYLNGYYIVFGGGYKYYSSNSSGRQHMPCNFIAYSTQLNSGWAVKYQIIGADSTGDGGDGTIVNLFYHNNNYITVFKRSKTMKDPVSGNNFNARFSVVAYTNNISNNLWNYYEINRAIGNQGENYLGVSVSFMINDYLCILDAKYFTGQDFKIPEEGLYLLYSNDIFNSEKWNKKILGYPRPSYSIYTLIKQYYYEGFNLQFFQTIGDKVFFKLQTTYRLKNTSSSQQSYDRYYFNTNAFVLPQFSEKDYSVYIKAE